LVAHVFTIRRVISCSRQALARMAREFENTDFMNAKFA
jgi:hypothetical protein